MYMSPLLFLRLQCIQQRMVKLRQNILPLRILHHVRQIIHAHVTLMRPDLAHVQNLAARALHGFVETVLDLVVLLHSFGGHRLEIGTEHVVAGTLRRDDAVVGVQPENSGQPSFSVPAPVALARERDWKPRLVSI